MNLFWNRKQNIEIERKQDVESSVEVVALKQEGHKTAKEADAAIKRLNKLLRADGITLKIYIAAGGRHGH